MHITTIKDDINCQERVQHNPLTDKFGMLATLQAAILVMVQINQFLTHMRQNFNHGIYFFALG